MLILKEFAVWWDVAAIAQVEPGASLFRAGSGGMGRSVVGCRAERPGQSAERIGLRELGGSRRWLMRGD